MSYTESNSDEWFYIERGSFDKKIGKSKEYHVQVKNFVITDCDCPARSFRRFEPCKHMKKVQERTPHLKFN